MSVFQHTTFYTTINHLQDLPPPNGVEIAFAGRSNAGKSSAINTITNIKGLARTSKSPGRTQMLNLFKLDDDKRLRGAQVHGIPVLGFIDQLPGFGVAYRAPHKSLHSDGEQ